MCNVPFFINWNSFAENHSLLRSTKFDKISFFYVQGKCPKGALSILCKISCNQILSTHQYATKLRTKLHHYLNFLNDLKPHASTYIITSYGA